MLIFDVLIADMLLISLYTFLFRSFELDK